MLCSLNLEFPDRSAFLASNNILTNHVSGHCSLFSYLYIFGCNHYCCQLLLLMIASWEAWNSELQINVFELVRLQKSILYISSVMYKTVKEIKNKLKNQGPVKCLFGDNLFRVEGYPKQLSQKSWPLCPSQKLSRMLWLSYLDRVDRAGREMKKRRPG